MGREIWFAVTDKYAGKIIEVLKGKKLSLQYHNKKHETMYILEGKAKINIDSEEFIAAPGDVFEIKPKTKHRLEALEDLRIIEVSTPELDDVVRLEDDYGRVTE